MTNAEHSLMIAMFVKQAQLIKTLIEVLKSRGLVSGDDLQAFEFRVNTDSPSNKQLLLQTTSLYLEAAKAVGVETGIENA